MFKQKREVSIINKVLIAMLIIVSVLAVAIILLPQLSKKIVEINVNKSEGMIKTYATTEENSWDVSKNGDGSVTATLSEDGTLTISGKGEMKDWNANSTTDWHSNEIKKTIKKVVVNDGVTSIGEMAFRECSNLDNIKITKDVKDMGEGSFLYCENLESIDIPEEITVIEEDTFRYCRSLEKLKIPSNIVSVGHSAFGGCSSLSYIHIPASVKSLGVSVFTGCSELSEIKVDVNNKEYCDVNGVLYTKDKTKIIKYPEGKTDGEYTILEEVTIIGESAFYYCENLKVINLQSGLKEIDYHAFRECIGLNNITIPESVEIIGGTAFYNCKMVSIVSDGDEIYLPDIFQRVQNEEDILYASNGLSLENCKLQGKKVLIDENSTFAEIKVQNGYLEGLTYLISYDKFDVSENGDGSVIGRLSDDGSLTISGIGDMKDWKWLDKTDWHNSGIKGMIKNVVINEGVTNIGEYAFVGCSNLKSIDIKKSVTSIEYSAFNACSKLTSINIPENVKSIGKPAFYGCNNLKEIKVNQNNTNYMDDNGVLYTKDKVTLVKYPEARDDTKYIILKGVTTIGTYAFNGCKNLTEIEIPVETLRIESDAFSGCSNLIKINFPEGLTDIGSYAFLNCNRLSDIKISESMTKISNDAFNNCYNLIILCYSGSYAETYAIENNIKYKLICLSSTEQEQQGFSGTEGIKNEVPDGKDETVAKKEIPKAGLNPILVTVLVAVMIVVIILYKKNKKYEGIN